MKLSVRSNGKNLTELNIKEKNEKKKEPEPVETLPESLSEQRLLTMNFSKKEGILKSVKTGITTNFAAPFGLAIGLNPTLVTLLTSIPQLLGSISVLFVEKLINFVSKRKKLMVLCSYLESYTWLLVLTMAILSIKNPWLLITLVTFDAIFMNIQYPIWNSIMSDTVPDSILGKYFGMRNFLVGVSSLLSVIIAGFVLNKTAQFNYPLMGFAIIFGIAFISAYSATSYQYRMIDPSPKIKSDSKRSFREFISTIKENNFGRYTWFFSTYQMFVYIAAPFYAIYLLEVLNFDYFTFTVISTAAAVSSLASMKIWGKLVDRYGSKKIMSITAFIIPFSPILWMSTVNWKLLTLIELLSGIVWAGFNLSCSTFMFESVKPEHKVKFYTYNKVLYGLGVFFGVLIGIALFNLPLGVGAMSSSIFLIFFVSGALRFITAFVFVPGIEEEKVVTIDFKKGNIFGRLITLRPKTGIQFEIIHDNLKYRDPLAEKIKSAEVTYKKEQERKEKVLREKERKEKLLLRYKQRKMSQENQKKDKMQKQTSINRKNNI